MSVVSYVVWAEAKINLYAESGGHPTSVRNEQSSSGLMHEAVVV